MESKSEPKPRTPHKILVPDLFDFPPAAARTRMSVPAYDLMFGKLSLRALFDNHFPRHPGMNVDAGFDITRRSGESNADLTATISKNSGDALLRWQRDSDDPNTFVDLLASTSKDMLRLRSCAYYPEYGIGAFGTFPLLMANRSCSEDYGVMGLRYVSKNLSIGASFVPFPAPCEVPYGAWLVGRKGSLSAGLQYKPLSECDRGVSKHHLPYTDMKNWNCAISYGRGSNSPLFSSFLFSLELARSTQLVASVYQHHILVKVEDEDFGNDRITGRLHYIDFGLELATRLDKDKKMDGADKSLFQIAGSWQYGSNLLVKGKFGPSKSSAAVVFKPHNHLVPPIFTFSATVENDHSTGSRSYGVGVNVGGTMESPSYRTADPYTMVLTESTQELDGEIKKREFQFGVGSGGFEDLPRELKAIDEIL